MGYTYQASVTIPAASGSTQANITIGLTGTDTKLKTVANGGQIQNVVTRVGQTVPADLILSSDLAGLNLYNWGWDFYDAVNGIVTIWVLIPSLTNASSITIYISIGNSLVSTYQGGIQGAEFDSNTNGVYHLSDGTTLSGKDFSSNSFDGTLLNTPTPTTGKIDGGGSFTAASLQRIDTVASSNFIAAGNTSIFTFSAWVKTTGTSGFRGIFGSNQAGGVEIRANNTTNTITLLRQGQAVVLTSASSLSTSAFIHVAVTYNNGAIVIYINGISDASTTSLQAWVVTGLLQIGGASGATEYFTGIVDEAKIANVARSADWIATEYANQNSLPVIGGFSLISSLFLNSNLEGLGGTGTKTVRGL